MPADSTTGRLSTRPAFRAPTTHGTKGLGRGLPWNMGKGGSSPCTRQALSRLGAQRACPGALLGRGPRRVRAHTGRWLLDGVTAWTGGYPSPQFGNASSPRYLCWLRHVKLPAVSLHCSERLDVIHFLLLETDVLIRVD